MNIPEKIYIDKSTGEFDDYWSIYQNNDSIEYIRKDAFVEKACEFLSKLSNYNEGFIYPSHSGVIDSFVNNFKNYMKGE